MIFWSLQVEDPDPFERYDIGSKIRLMLGFCAFRYKINAVPIGRIYRIFLYPYFISKGTEPPPSSTESFLFGCVDYSFLEITQPPLILIAHFIPIKPFTNRVQ